MKSLLSFLLVSCMAIATATKSAGDTLVLPNDSEATPGIGAQIPFHGNAGRYQTIFGANQFQTAPTEGIIVNEIAFRIDETDRNAYQGSIRDVEARMSTTPSLQPVLTTARFDGNVGADYRPVFRGKVDYSIAGSAETVNTFSLRILLQEPFGYNPSHGSLLVDLLVHEGSSTSLYIDAGTPLEHVIGLDGNTVNPVGTFQVPLILKLGFSPVPEPSILALLLSGTVCLLLNKRSRE